MPHRKENVRNVAKAVPAMTMYEKDISGLSPSGVITPESPTDPGA